MEVSVCRCAVYCFYDFFCFGACTSPWSRSPHLFDDDLSVLVDGAVVDHAHDGHAQVAADAEGDAEAEAAHDGDDVALGQAEALALAQRGLLRRGLPGPPVLRQLDHLPGLLPPLDHPARTRHVH